MLDVLFGSPIPALRTPERAVPVSTSLNKSQELVVGNVMTFNGEFRDVYLMSGKFVVPTKFVSIFSGIVQCLRILESQRGASCGDFHEARLHARCFPGDVLGARNLFVGREPVEHVGQRLRMHQAMLDGDVEHLHQVGMAFLRPLQSALDGTVEFFTDALVVTFHFGSRGPICRRVRRQSVADGVDPKGKELIESGVEGTETESALRKQVPVKGFDVADIKNDAVPLRDRPVV